MSDLRKCCGTPRGHESQHKEDCPNKPGRCVVRTVSSPRPTTLTREESMPDWSRKCLVCGQKPVLPVTGMCGPCTFGDANTVNGNW